MRRLIGWSRVGNRKGTRQGRVVQGLVEDLGPDSSAQRRRLVAAAGKTDWGKGGGGGGGGAEAIVQAQAGDDGGWGHRSREMWTDLGRF